MTNKSFRTTLFPLFFSKEFCCLQRCGSLFKDPETSLVLWFGVKSNQKKLVTVNFNFVDKGVDYKL